jgi:hypothetical protein
MNDDDHDLMSFDDEEKQDLGREGSSSVNMDRGLYNM